MTESVWGYGMQNALYPSGMGGPFGLPVKPLPNNNASPAFYGYPGYRGNGNYMLPDGNILDLPLVPPRNIGPKLKFGKKRCSFGFSPRELIPNGISTESGWGWKSPDIMVSRMRKFSRTKRPVKRSVRRPVRRSVRRPVRRSRRSKTTK